MRRSSDSESLRPNRSALLALLVLMALLPILVLVSVADHRQERKTLNRALSFEASEQAEMLRNYFLRSRSLTQVMASNPAFRQFYELPGSRAEKIAAQGPVVREANRALAYLEELFPNSIGEACFIDRGGPENARAVKGKVEGVKNLSPDETGASFFAPAFALDVGEVFQTRPYLSPDTNEWVIANATPIQLRDGSKPGIVHFEVTMESFRVAAAEASERFDIQIVDAKTGGVILDSRHTQRLGGKLGRPDDRRYAGSLLAMRYDETTDRAASGPRVGSEVGPRGNGTMTVDGYPIAFNRLAPAKNNANDWIVVALAREPATSWLESLSSWDVAVMLGAILLLALAAASLRGSQRELRSAALDDSLTKLGNRRRLIADLEHELTADGGGRPFVLALFDLDGFKAYNDSFGHPAGDALLARLAGSLERAVAGRGRAYRMGGDEFCLIAPLGLGDSADDVAASAAAALAESGEGFSITASYGAATLPEEAELPAEALRLADSRMYFHKASSRPSALSQSMDVLIRVLAERSPDLRDHLDGVATMAEQVAESLGLPQEDVAEIRRAASVHDIGKVAIPDAILTKPGPLTDEEWQFMRRHTLTGERILGGAPALTRVARIVRATHEQMNGNGYPDGLRGEDIPLAARIIAVCDAFEAMTSDRPYRNAMSVEVAVDELRRCAGTQFDARVVEVFCSEVVARLAELRGRSPAVRSD